MKRHNKALGAWGEEKAAEYLQRQGYAVCARNFRWARGELDIIAERGELLVFVEVKTAGSERMGPPETWVTRQKQAQIGQVALRYLQTNEIENRDCRFDVIGVIKSDDSFKITHIENAFWLEQ